MLRFADLLEAGLRERSLNVTRLEPGRTIGGSGPLAKWRGYADKFLFAPHILKRQLQPLANSGETVIAHICDHSNAPYLPLTQGFPTLVTCHDVMAIKSGLGLVPQNPTRLSGRLLQSWIFRHLKQAPFAACVSSKTRHDLQTLTGLPDERVSIVPNALPYAFHPSPDASLPATVTEPYFLHVGSDAWYKNRTGVYALYRQLFKTSPKAHLVFVGPENADLQREINHHHLGSRVHFLNGLENEQLMALYSRAECLLFPSWEEGFGWPIAEAQACGCPVAVLDREPMNEVAGRAAILLPPAPIKPGQTEKWAQQCTPLITQALHSRQELVRLGLDNTRRFTIDRMIDDYIALYKRLAEN